jgi:malonyl-CoA O-methyltransferase
MSAMNKDRIRQRFTKSIATYNRCAEVQKQMSEFLLTTLHKKAGTTFPHILEIGCGTGLLTKQAIEQFTFSTFTANDLVPDVKPIIQDIAKSIRFIPGDCETVTTFPKKQDLILSNATFQWITDLDQLLAKFHTLLNPGGIVAFSAFGPDHFLEIKQLLGPGLQYLNKSQINKTITPHFEIIHCSNKKVSLYFKDAFAVLKHLKTTGVNSLYQRAWSKSKLQNFAQQYDDNFMCDQGVPLTFHPFYCILRRKA